MDKKNSCFYNEDGTMRSIEEIIEEYNAEIEANTNPFVNSSLNAFVHPDYQIDSIKALETFSFISRNLYLTDEIKHEHAISFSDAISFWNFIDETDGVPVEEREPIKIFIDTPGGDLDATLSIIDCITLSKTPVWTITTGSGSSGGFFVGMCGHKRIGYPHSTYLFHEGSCQNGGDAHKYFQFDDFYKKRLKTLKELTLEKTKFTEEFYKNHKKDDVWLSAEEALQKGIIDEIATELI